MSNLTICRVCLASNTKMHHIANTPYQEILEKLATELYTADGRPETVCWMCLSALRRVRRLRDTARAAHEILTQLSLSGIQPSEDTVSMLDQKLLCKIAWTPIQFLSFDKEFKHAPIKVEIKEDPSENEIAGLISEDEQINCTVSKDESFTVKNEEIFCDNTSIGENEQQTERTTEQNEEHTDNCENKQSTSDISGNYQTTNHTSISENEEHTDIVSKNEEQTDNYENEQSTGDISGNYQTTNHTSISENEEHTDTKSLLMFTDTVSKNYEQTGKISENEQSAACDISGNYQTTNHISISENEEHINKDTKNEEQNGNISENEQSISDICENHQTTDIRSVKQPKNKVRKTYGGNRLKSKKSSEVIVKDQKGLDCVRHICQTCDKTYKQRCHLLRHLKTHGITASQPSDQPPQSTPKDVICDKCGKGLANNYTLKKHLLGHQDIRNFVCAHCSIKLVQKSDLVRHMRTHTGEKPYKCDACDKQYSQKAMLVRHMRIHTGETPYSCERCGLNFNRHSSMVRHLKRRHFSSDKQRYKGQRRPWL